MVTHYTGTLRRGPTPGTIAGELRDIGGWAIQITGTRQADGSYLLVGALGEPPAKPASEAPA